MGVKVRLVIPKKIVLASSVIKIQFASIPDFGEFNSAMNIITINSGAVDAVKSEVFFHEVAEAINNKFVNEQAGDQVTDHRIIDAYGRGMYDFWKGNFRRLVEVEVVDGKERSE